MRTHLLADALRLAMMREIEEHNTATPSYRGKLAGISVSVVCSRGQWGVVIYATREGKGVEKIGMVEDRKQWEELKALGFFRMMVEGKL